MRFFWAILFCVLGLAVVASLAADEPQKKTMIVMPTPGPQLNPFLFKLPKPPPRPTPTANIVLLKPKPLFISADELKTIYIELEKKASKEELKTVADLKKVIEKQKLPFTVGITSVSGKDIRQITGLVLPKDLDKRLKGLARERAVLAPRTGLKSIAVRPIVLPSPQVATSGDGEKAPGASYYGMGASQPISDWMSESKWPLPTQCSPTLPKWASRDYLPPIRHQQTCGSCWSFSASAAVEASQALVNGSFYDFSEQQAIDCAKKPDGTDVGSCNGGWYQDVFAWLKGSGSQQEKDFPYIAKDGICPQRTPSLYMVADWDFADPASPANPSIAKIKEAICSHGAVSAIVTATDAFNNYRSGVLAKDSSGCSRPEGCPHAITLVGWDDTKNAWILRNSWGSGWGEGGYAWIDYNTDDVGHYATWVQVAQGDGGNISGNGIFYTRELKVKNSTGKSIDLYIRYLAWTGTDGWRWLPSSSQYYHWRINPGMDTYLLSPFSGRLRAAEANLWATTVETKKKTIDTYKAKTLDLTPDDVYQSSDPATFAVDITNNGIVPLTTIEPKKEADKQTRCKHIDIASVYLSVPRDRVYDQWDGPDLIMNIFPENYAGSWPSDVAMDSYAHTWTLPFPMVFISNTTVHVYIYDADTDESGTVGYEYLSAMDVTVPDKLENGVFTFQKGGFTVSFSGECVP